jgi:hypothetical protein
MEPPDGILDEHQAGRGGPAWVTGAAGVLVLAAVLVAGILGVFGAEGTVQAGGDVAMLSVNGPNRIRSGEFFEMRFTVIAREQIAEPVVTVAASVWKDITINTMVPAPAEESFSGEAYRFSFEPLSAGDRLVFQVDGQINPDHLPGLTSGEIELLDADRVLAELRYELGVLP